MDPLSLLWLFFILASMQPTFQRQVLMARRRYALSSISFALTDMLIGHLDLFPQLIRTGNFDIVLVRPRSTLLQIFASDFAVRRFAKAVQGGAVLIYALTALDLEVDVRERRHPAVGLAQAADFQHRRSSLRHRRHLLG